VATDVFFNCTARQRALLGLAAALMALAAGLSSHRVCAADQPQWGHAWTRNLISEERGLPSTFDPRTGKNVKWAVRLGTETHATPIISQGRVYIGANNGEPRDPKHKGDRGVMMCLAEDTGKLLWQLVVPKRIEDIYLDWPNSGICSPPTVEGDRVYVASNRGEILCLDVQGMANGNDGPFREEGPYITKKDAQGKIPEGEVVLEPGPLDADVLWLFDLTRDAGAYMHDGVHVPILIDGDYLYLNTSTGVDNTHRKIRTPDAPSLIVLDKKTGKLIARDQEKMAPNVFHATWSGPSMARVNGKPLIFFLGGNGIVYAFEPLPPGLQPTAEPRALTKVWQFDFDPTGPKENVHRFNSNRRESPSNFFGLPVFVDGKLFIAGGGDIWWGKNEAWLKCIRADGSGDVTERNLVWKYDLQKHVLATPAVANGCVFIGDTGRTFHCVDAQTGKGLWTHEIKGEAWASALVADGKVYFGSRGGTFYVFAADREKNVLSTVELVSPMSATPTAANGVLYVTTMTHLYALKEGAGPQ
jgi:outer membrane protein assembly factor BamB